LKKRGRKKTYPGQPIRGHHRSFYLTAENNRFVDEQSRVHGWAPNRFVNEMVFAFRERMGEKGVRDTFDEGAT